MSSVFKLEIVTPEKSVFQGEVESLVVPAYEGYLGVMAHHSPLLSQLIPGEITIRTGTEILHFSSSGGFIEVSGNKAMVLADAVEKMDEIDVERAKRAKERAWEELKRPKSGDTESARFDLKRAENRIRLAGKYKGGNV